MTHAELDYRGTKVMEEKKVKPASTANVSFNHATEFASEIKQELFRITWPSWEELKTYTQIVVGATFAFGIGLYLVDLTIQSVLNVLGILTRLISG